MTARRNLAIVAVVACAVVAASCGDAEAPGSGSASRSSARKACSPVPAERAADVGQAASGQAPAELELSGSPATLEVLGSTRKVSIAGHFGHERQFRAPQGVVFIAVTYELENRGSTTLEPSRAVNRVALIRDETGRTWHVADAPRTCGPISASLAKAQGISNPENEASPEEVVTTAAVFSVPSRADGLEFLIPDQGLALRLSPAA